MYQSLSDSDDDSPRPSIGKGKYDYLVGVYYPNETTLVSGSQGEFRRPDYLVGGVGDLCTSLMWYAERLSLHYDMMHWQKKRT